jgi:uncharacterized membrane protein
MEEPFEPMDRASLKNITLKTVFFVALATTQWRSELHALSYEKFSFDKERGEVQEIMQAVEWKSHMVFSQVYLGDCWTVVDGMSTLGPVVDATSVI